MPYTRPRPMLTGIAATTPRTHRAPAGTIGTSTGGVGISVGWSDPMHIPLTPKRASKLTYTAF